MTAPKHGEPPPEEPAGGAPAPVTPEPGAATPEPGPLTDLPATPKPGALTPEPGAPATPAPVSPGVPATPEPDAPATPEPDAPATPAPFPPTDRPVSRFREVAEVDLRKGVPADERAADAIDYPMVNEDDAAAVPLGKRLRDPRTLISFILPIGVLLLLAFALPGFHLDQLPRLILDANPWWLLAALAIYYLGFPLRGYRWALLVRGTGHPLRTKDATEIIFLSWLVNCVVPAKLGDVYRAYLLRVSEAVALSTTFGTVFIERVFDLIAIVGLGLLAGYWSLHNDMSDTVRIIFLTGFLVVAALTLGLLVVRNFGRRLLVRLPVPKRIVTMYDLFEEGMFSVDRRTVPVIGILTVLIWTTEALRLLFVVQALHFSDVTLGISGAFFVALIASLLTAVPLTPAGVGLVEGGIVFVLTNVYNVPKTEALAIALVDRAISVLSIIVLGSIAYVLSSKTKARIRQPGPEPSEATAQP